MQAPCSTCNFTFIIFNTFLNVVLCILLIQSVEQDLSEVQQAIALRILLTQTKRHPDHNREFINMGGYDMVNKVLCSSHCIIGYHMLKVSLNERKYPPVS